MPIEFTGSKTTPESGLSDLARGFSEAFRFELDGLRQLSGSKPDLSYASDDNTAETIGKLAGNAAIFIGTTMVAKRLPVIGTFASGRLATIAAGGILGFAAPVTENDGIASRLINLGVGAATMSVLEFGPAAISKIPQLAGLSANTFAGSLGRTTVTNAAAGIVQTEGSSLATTGRMAAWQDVALGAVAWSATGATFHAAGAKLVSPKSEPAIVSGRFPPHLRDRMPVEIQKEIPPQFDSLHGQQFELPKDIFKKDGKIDLIKLSQELTQRHNPAKSYESGAFVRGQSEIYRTFQKNDTVFASVPLPAEKSVASDIMFHTHPPGCLPGPSGGDLQLTKGLGIIATGSSRHTNFRPLTTFYEGQFAANTAGKEAQTRALMLDIERQTATYESSLQLIDKAGNASDSGIFTGGLRWSDVEPVLRNWDIKRQTIESIPGFRTSPMSMAEFFGKAS